jgi:hypothetical protein
VIYGNNLEGRDRGLILRHYTGIPLEVLRNTTKASFKIAVFRAEI